MENVGAVIIALLCKLREVSHGVGGILGIEHEAVFSEVSIHDSDRIAVLRGIKLYQLHSLGVNGDVAVIACHKGIAEHYHQ